LLRNTPQPPQFSIDPFIIFSGFFFFSSILLSLPAFVLFSAVYPVQILALKSHCDETYFYDDWPLIPSASPGRRITLSISGQPSLVREDQLVSSHHRLSPRERFAHYSLYWATPRIKPGAKLD
jgi:hypothetical protein